MTEYEMASLWLETIGLMQTTVSNFFAVLSAFMIASFVAAHRLTSTMTIIAISLFVLYMAIGLFTLSRELLAFFGLVLEMQKVAEAGSGLVWHAVAKTPAPVLTLALAVAILVYVIATGAAIYFFFHCRRVNRKAEPGELLPKVSAVAD
jgi:hypothetical protein